MARKLGKKKDTKNNEGIFKFTGEDNKEYRLTVKEKLFCIRYLEERGNGTQAAFEIYDCKNMKVAASVAYENLRKPHIIAFVNSKLNEYGFNDDNVKKQHLYTLNQFADLAQKNKAVDMFYKLKGEYAPEKLELTKRKWQHLTNEELAARIRAAKDYLLKR
jgi:hypothetical protein